MKISPSIHTKNLAKKMEMVQAAAAVATNAKWEAEKAFEKSFMSDLSKRGVRDGSLVRLKLAAGGTVDGIIQCIMPSTVFLDRFNLMVSAEGSIGVPRIFHGDSLVKVVKKAKVDRG